MFAGLIAAALAVGSGATYLITKNSRSVQPQERVVEKVVEIEKSPAAHFTAYQAADYPDLTYAAENAVNAVVNIEVTQQVQMRNVDPFLEFSEYRRVTPAAGSMCLANSRRAVRASSSRRTVISLPTIMSWITPPN